MKTIIYVALFFVASILGAPVAVHAQNPVIGQPENPSDSPVVSPQASSTPKATKPELPSPGDDAARGDAYYYFVMGHLNEQQYEATGKPELAIRAIDSYKKALDLDPNSTVIMERLAETRAKSQQLREAVDEARAVLKLDPDNVDAHKLLARIYVRTLGDQGANDAQKENLAKAITEFQAILKIQPDDTYSSLWLARLYRFENHHTEAEKVLRDVLQRDPGNGPALEQLSQLLIDEGRSQEAVKILSDAAGTSSSPEVYDLLGDAYAQAKDYPKSESAYRKAAEEDPDDPGHLHGLAQALMEQDKYADALEQFKKLSEVEPGTAENYLRMAQLYRRLGKFDLAESSLLRAKQLSPGSLEVLYNEALLYEDQGRYEDAVKVLSDSIAALKSQPAGAGADAPNTTGSSNVGGAESNPNALPILYEQLGHAYREAQNYPAAIKTYQEMATLSPEAQKRAQMLMIDTYRENRDIDRAITETKKLLDASPNDSNLTVTLAMLYAEKSDSDTATKLLSGLLRGNDSDAEIYLNIAQAQERGKKYDEAEKSAAKAEELSPDSDSKQSAWFLLGAIYERQKKFDLAEQEFRKVLEANPNSAAVLNYYGYMLADRGVRLAEATAMIQKAVAQEPGNGAYLDSLGWAFYKQNKLTEAEETLQKASEHESHDPTILGHLGDVYAKMGQTDRAAQYWERALTEWQKAVPADYEADKVNELDAQLKNLKRRTALKTSPDAPKPQ